MYLTNVTQLRVGWYTECMVPSYAVFLDRCDVTGEAIHDSHEEDLRVGHSVRLEGSGHGLSEATTGHCPGICMYEYVYPYVV